MTLIILGTYVPRGGVLIQLWAILFMTIVLSFLYWSYYKNSQKWIKIYEENRKMTIIDHFFIIFRILTLLGGTTLLGLLVFKFTKNSSLTALTISISGVIFFFLSRTLWLRKGKTKLK